MKLLAPKLGLGLDLDKPPKPPQLPLRPVRQDGCALQARLPSRGSSTEKATLWAPHDRAEIQKQKHVENTHVHACTHAYTPGTAASRDGQRDGVLGVRGPGLSPVAFMVSPGCEQSSGSDDEASDAGENVWSDGEADAELDELELELAPELELECASAV